MNKNKLDTFSIVSTIELKNLKGRIEIAEKKLIQINILLIIYSACLGLISFVSMAHFIK